MTGTHWQCRHRLAAGKHLGQFAASTRGMHDRHALAMQAQARSWQISIGQSAASTRGEHGRHTLQDPCANAAYAPEGVCMRMHMQRMLSRRMCAYAAYECATTGRVSLGGRHTHACA